MEITVNNIIDIARSQIGTPFRHQGRIPGMALDCAGLVAIVAQSLGVEYNEWPGYGRNPHDGLLESVMDGQPSVTKIGASSESAVAGDILMIKFRADPQHLAICAGDTIIHSYSAAGKVCEHIFDSKWRQRVTAVYRFNGVSA